MSDLQDERDCVNERAQKPSGIGRNEGISVTLPGGGATDVRGLPGHAAAAGIWRRDRVPTSVQAQLALILAVLSAMPLGAQGIAPDRSGPSVIPPPKPFRTASSTLQP